MSTVRLVGRWQVSRVTKIQTEMGSKWARFLRRHLLLPSRTHLQPEAPFPALRGKGARDGAVEGRIISLRLVVSRSPPV